MAVESKQSVAALNASLKKAEAKAWELEPKLQSVVEKELIAAGDHAADRFTVLAGTATVTASGRSMKVGRPRRRRFLWAAADVKPTSTMVALRPTDEQAEAIATETGADADTLHITLAYIGDVEGELTDIENALSAVAALHAPLQGAVAGVGMFEDNGKGHPIILLPSVPGLVELRVDATEALQDAGIDFGRNYGYQAHMTIDYAAQGLTGPYSDVFGQALDFASLWIVRGDRDFIELPFTGSTPLTAAAPPHSTWTIPAGEEVLPINCEPTPHVKQQAEPEFKGFHAAAPSTEEEQVAFCLTHNLRTKTDPVRRAVIETTAKETLEGVGIDFDVTNPLIDKALSETASQITEISQTTQRDVMRIIRTSYNQGLSIPDTAKAIRTQMAEAAPARATLIARTELVGAVNGGSIAATQVYADATGDKLDKVWLTSPGAQYPRHELYEDLDGQTVPLDGFFDVGGAQMQFPGDPSGPAEEVCNCRCTVIYQLVGGEEVGSGDAEDEGGDIPVVTGD